MYITKSDIGIASIKIIADQRSCFKDIDNVHSKDTFIWDLMIRVKCRNKDIAEKICNILEGGFIEGGSVPDTMMLNDNIFVINEFCVIGKNDYEIRAVPDGIYRYDIWEKTFVMNGFISFVRNFIRAGVMRVFGDNIELHEDVG